MTGQAANSAPLELRWSIRDASLAPLGVLALDGCARRLGQRLLEEPAARLKLWRGLSGTGLLALFGDELPWVDGVQYLGKEGGLWMPTWLQPSVPASWLSRALANLHGAGQWLVVPRCGPDDVGQDAVTATPLLLSAAQAGPLAVSRIRSWLAAESGEQSDAATSMAPSPDQPERDKEAPAPAGNHARGIRYHRGRRNSPSSTTAWRLGSCRGWGG